MLHAQVSPTDFARGAEIRAEGGSLFRILLPDDVYETVTRTDLGDIRVLNAAGDAVPHALRRPSRPALEDAEWSAAPSFPMSSAQSEAVGRTQVRVGANGAVLEVTGTSARQQTTAYLVDVSAFEQPLARLSLAWTAPARVTFLARVSVEGSNDLNVWRTLVPSTAIAQLERDGVTLIQNEIELPHAAQAVKYLRMAWPKELEAVKLTGVRVRPRRTPEDADVRWRTLTSDHTEPSGAAAYDANALFPVEYVDLEFVDAADTASVSISSRPTSSAGWTLRHAGLFYSLRDANQRIRSVPARVAQSADRYWTVQRATGRWPSDRAPRLKIGWHPHELVFIAQGSAPYTLAYGSARVDAADTPVEALLTRLERDRNYRVPAASLAPARSLGGPEMLTEPAPVRQIVLWAVLAAAVAALAWIAVRTFRDVKPT
jgi:hypothetical protein